MKCYYLFQVAVGGAAEADNSVPCQPDSKEDSGKVIEVIKETDNVTGGDPGVFSLEKRRRKKKKAASIEGLGHEAMENESGQEKGNDLILEKEIIKEVVDTGLINIAGKHGNEEVSISLNKFTVH